MFILKTNDKLALKVLMTDDLYMVKAQQEVSAAVPEVILVQEEVYFKYLGENNKYILFLVDEPGGEIISQDNLKSLLNILKAKKQELRDVAILNYYAFAGTSFQQLKSFFACTKLVLIGINPSSLALSEVSANQISVHEGVKILASFSFAEMGQDEVKKRIFWNEMKNF